MDRIIEALRLQAIAQTMGAEGPFTDEREFKNSYAAEVVGMKEYIRNYFGKDPDQDEALAVFMTALSEVQAENV